MDNEIPKNKKIWDVEIIGNRRKMELPQNLLETFACVTSEKKNLSSKNGVATKFIANVRFFLLVYA